MQFLYTPPSGLFEKSMKLGAKNLRHCMYSTYSMYSAFTVHMYIVQCTYVQINIQINVGTHQRGELQIKKSALRKNAKLRHH